MLLKLIRFFRGYVDFCADGKFPERFMNITARYGINIWNAVPVKSGISASMYLGDYRKIRSVARKAKVKAHIINRHGMPFIIDRYKPRLGLAAGAAAGIIILLILSNFIWSIKIIGTSSVSDTYLTQVLADNNVCVGAYKNDIDVESVERRISLKIKQIGWMSINITGNVINVEVKEKTEKPLLDTGTKPCNIKASRDGVITKIKATSGTTVVLTGSGVAKGELLVSGINETKLETVQYVRAKAEVFADVTEKRKITLPKNCEYYSLQENKTERNRAKFLWLDFPCSLSFESYDESVSFTRTKNLFINDVVLPVGLNTQTTCELKKKKAVLDYDTAKKIIDNDALLYEVFKKQDSSVKKRDIKLTKSKSFYNAEIDYIFNENIAESVEFDVTDTG